MVDSACKLVGFLATVNAETIALVRVSFYVYCVSKIMTKTVEGSLLITCSNYISNRGDHLKHEMKACIGKLDRSWLKKKVFKLTNGRFLTCL